MTKKQKITLYVLRTLISLLFLMAAIPKLLAQPEAVQGFAVAGLPLWFVYFIGIAEILGAIGLWIKKTSLWATWGLGIIMIGAVVVTFEFVSKAEAILPLVVGLLLIVIAKLNTTHPAITEHRS